jgi:1-acyl-sn-glycerol-3-phosphate acyltransferase
MMPLIHILRGVITLGLLVIVTLVNAVMICLSWLVTLPLPGKYRFHVRKIINQFPFIWVGMNNFIFKCLLPTRFHLDIPKQLSREKWYLIIANHQSWVDILLLYKAFNLKTSMLKFFLKRELLWLLPIVGFACYTMHFPFLVRHSKKHLRKDPESRWKDIQTTQKACEKFKIVPASVINFAEGTRFTAEKQQRKRSDYQYLLKPKVAGIALVLSSMEKCLSGILDVTIKYSSLKPTFWKFISGQVAGIDVYARLLPIPKSFIGDYYQDRSFRKQLQQSFNDIWATKDAFLSQLHHQES